MGKKVFARIKRALGISLIVLFVVSVTAASVSAQPTASAKVTGKTYSVSFSSDGSKGTGLTYVWFFGDKRQTNIKNPIHTYTDGIDKMGTHTVFLKVTDSNGDDDTVQLDNI
jgi:PKD repeat protein